MSELAWKRFVLNEEDADADSEEVRVWELAREGVTVFIRKLRGSNKVHVERKWLARVERAERALKRQVRELMLRGYLEAGTVKHGRVQSVPQRLFADYYESPAAILTIVYARLRGDLVGTDDADLPGFADECKQRMRVLPNRL